jgi:regulator of sigma E protease
MFSLLVFFFLISILIIIHEFGHFIMAKRNGVRVEKFSLGFGPIIFSKKIKDTQYSFSLIPFGGYVKLAGDSLLEYQGRPDEYLSKSPGVRARIIIMGPFLNYLMAFFCFWLIFYLGYPMLTTKIDEVLPDYGAKEAGILPQDKIIAVDGKSVQFWDQLQKEIYPKKEGEIIELKVLRQNQTYTFKVKIKEKEITDIWGNKKRVGLIGIRPAGEIVPLKHTLISSVIKGSKKVIDLTFITYATLFRIVLGKLSLRESVTGPLGMFYLTKEATRLGLVAILHLIAVLNISLAVFNLLPIPVLDGAHLFLLGIEKIRKRKIGYKLEQMITHIGLAFIITLAIFIFYNDLMRFGVWEKITQFLKR